eukprot:g4874.t1
MWRPGAPPTNAAKAAKRGGMGPAARRDAADTAALSSVLDSTGPVPEGGGEARVPKSLSSTTQRMRFMSRKTEAAEQDRLRGELERERERIQWVAPAQVSASSGGGGGAGGNKSGRPRLVCVRDSGSNFAGTGTNFSSSARVAFGGFNKEVTKLNSSLVKDHAQTSREEAVEAAGIDDNEMFGRFAKMGALPGRGPSVSAAAAKKQQKRRQEQQQQQQQKQKKQQQQKKGKKKSMKKRSAQAVDDDDDDDDEQQESFTPLRARGPGGGGKRRKGPK